jgi:alkanesulfonate monooxygenase SsuD/methylene tetrahydromethanopterin reductase-like flavin-dependent oxidoreductase (luciferase family)
MPCREGRDRKGGYWEAGGASVAWPGMEVRIRRFGLLGSARARRGGPDTDGSEGFRGFIDANVEAEDVGFYSSFVARHHFAGHGEVSATLNPLTWPGARTCRLRLGTVVMALPWPKPFGRAFDPLRVGVACIFLITDSVAGDPGVFNEASALYGNPEEVAAKLGDLAAAGAGSILLNGGGSGGGARDRASLRRFARRTMRQAATPFGSEDP